MKKTILVVDDEVAMLKILSFILTKSYDVVTKKDGDEALFWLQQGNIPDLVIVDINMPNVDGYSFIKNVRVSGFFKDIPIVVLSANDKSEDRIKCLNIGADDFIVKPFNPEELKARISSIFRRVGS
ncbi:response regulator receiver protein [Chloroherpeton thalassium ATCC 35110]|uniref:Response regulator receiver protein n=1 Tax=Chloroherpeton thalassium (strain ATCC 35110 / GB-78) TaxID=517418 RepID=B3QU65_CHLT3|nr:response regulator transcription factor [Chloroherpeton thalassium]ACF12863.1 response regulator receiver protein [Chloroherpeton thalassium ATCC 35110]